MDAYSVFKNWLKNLEFISDEDCKLFEPFLKTIYFKKGDLFLSEGKICREMGFIVKGGFRSYYLKETKEINTNFVFENQFAVDYHSFIDERPSKFYIEALEDSQVIAFNLQALQNAYNQSHQWERLGRLMAERASREINNRVESFLFYSGEQRYLQLLATEPHIFQRVPLFHIASFLGLERESLSRLRKKISHK